VWVARTHLPPRGVKRGRAPPLFVPGGGGGGVRQGCGILLVLVEAAERGLMCGEADAAAQTEKNGDDSIPIGTRACVGGG